MTRRLSRCPGAAALALVAIVLAGCGEAEIIPAPIHDLSEPWQAQPFAIDPTLVTAVERLCRNQQEFPAKLPLVLLDARGDNRLLLVFANAGDESDCFVKREPGGRLTFESGGGSSSDPPPPAPQPQEIRFSGAGSQGGPRPMSYGVGEAGAAVSIVEMVPPSGLAIRASLNRGWFAAWWYGLDHDAVIRVRAYDAAGRLVASSP
jgi:hypothetical protein